MQVHEGRGDVARSRRNNSNSRNRSYCIGRAGHVAFAKKIAILSLHLQPKTLSFREILRPFLAEPIAKLEGNPVEAMAIVARWSGRRITLDGSAAIANGLYIQSEREFESTSSFDQIRAAVSNDELTLFKLLDVEEVAS
jgi:hypothetical protein